MKNNSITKNAIWQLIGKFILQGIAFFTTPIFTRLLTPEDFGYSSLYISWLQILSLLIGLQTSGSIQNALLKYDKEEIQKYYSSIMSLSFITFSFLLLIGIIFNNFCSKILSIRTDLVILVIIQSFSTYIISFKISIYDANKEVNKSTILSCIQTILSVALSLIFVFIFSKNKVYGKIYGQAIPVIIISVILIFNIYVKGKCLWNNEYIKFCLKLTVPLIIHGLGHLIFTQSDKIMLNKMQNDTLLGIYSVTFSLSSVLSIIYMALNSTWVPFYYDYKKENNENEIIFHSKRYIKLFTLICVGFCLLAYDVYKLFAPIEYYDGMKIIPFFVISLYFNFIYLFPVNFEFFHEQTKLIPVGTILAALINIVINYILIPKYGIVGASIGTMSAHILLFIFHWFIVKKIIKEKFEYKIIMFIPYILLLVCTAIITYFMKDLIIIRWILALMLGFYILFDIIKKKSLF